jgi:hypothetical protein
MSTTETTFDPTEYKQNLDESIAGVMPDSWVGHGRIVLFESDAVPDTKVDSLIESLERLNQEHDHSPETIAEAIIDQL